MDWSSRSIELVWAASLAAVPVAMLAAVCSRWKWIRPATRHALWFAVLATLLSPVLIGLWRPAWFRSERVLAAADTAVETVIRSAKTARSAYSALSPLEIDPAVGSRVDSPDLDESLPTVAAPTFRAAPPVEVKRPAPRPARTDLQAARNDVRGTLAHPSTAPKTTTTAQSRPRKQAEFVGPPAPIVSHLTDEDLGLNTPPAPVTAPAPAKSAPAVAGSSVQVRDWLGALLQVRDAVAAVPAIPPVIWVAGAVLLAGLWSVRILRVQRMLRRAEPAPEPLVSLVRRLAHVAGVKRVPQTLIVNDRISPMIWCGLRPRLVIPRGLWGELDARCQCAVIVHELSHLRRRDHRLCVLESVIGLIYWWHPIAWWARSRLRDEAEACCDAWVTTLLPGGRRAYAEALVTTKSYLSVPGRSGAPGLSVVSGRTRQMARRITMVMTQRVAPKASWMGMAFALAVGAAGMFVMPGLACPPEDEKSSSQAKVVARQPGEKAKLEAELKSKAKADKDKVAKAEKEKKAGQAFYGEAPALEAMRRGEKQPLDGQMNTLKDMEKSLQQMEQRLKEMQRRLEGMQNQPGAPRSQNTTTPAPRVATGQGLRTTIAGPGAMTLVTPDGGVAAIAGPTQARDYKLPKGKLDALVALMARDDVPIYISSNGDAITVNATPAQHQTFQAFVVMIHPEGKGQSGQIQHLDHLFHEGQHNQVRAAAVRAQAEQLRSQARTLNQQKAATQRQSETVKRQIERARKDAERAREKARQKGDEAEAERVEGVLEAQIEALEGQLDAIECQCDNFDCQIETIEEAIEALSEPEHSSLAPASPAMPALPATPAAAPAPAAVAMPVMAPAAPATPAACSTPCPAAPCTAPAPAAAPATPAAPAPAAPPAPLTTAVAPTAPAAAR